MVKLFVCLVNLFPKAEMVSKLLNKMNTYIIFILFLHIHVILAREVVGKLTLEGHAVLIGIFLLSKTEAKSQNIRR